MDRRRMAGCAALAWFAAAAACAPWTSTAGDDDSGCAAGSDGCGGASTSSGPPPSSPSSSQPSSSAPASSSSAVAATSKEWSSSSAAPASSSSATDATPPEISALREDAVMPQRARVCLDTNEPAQARVDWGSGTVMDRSVQEPAWALSRCVDLPGLQPLTPYRYTVAATDASGNTAVSAPRAFTTPATAAADIAMIVDADASTHAISEWIYGNNTLPADAASRHGAPTLARAGGNRWTAYNWENNASNAGNNWNFQNDGFLVMRSAAPDAPGQALREAVEPALAANASVVLTVPIQGYVAADKRGDGDVRSGGAAYLQDRFDVLRPTKGSRLSLSPDRLDRAVYADEMVYWVEQNFIRPSSSSAPQVFYGLDNEPDLWASTHAEIQPEPVTYAQVTAQSVAVARAIRAQAPSAVIFGPALSGWYGFTSLSGAPDAEGRDFLSVYLNAMLSGSALGQPLLDVVDVHWYPEARGGGVRITEDDASPAVAAARVQAPRALWDPTFREDSWIQHDSLGDATPIRLLPRLADKIDVTFPNRRIAVTEYYYGGGGHISGALAQADVLGIFGRAGVFAAALWHLGNTDDRFIHAAFALYRNFDGAGGRFGRVSAGADTDDVEASSVYAATDPAAPGRVTVVVLNKTAAWKSARITTRDLAATPSSCAVYRITAESPQPVRAGAALLEAGAVYYDMPPWSASLLLLSPP